MVFDAVIPSGKLSQSDLAVVDYVSKHPQEVLDMSVRELAAAAFVSTATVSRLCKKAGFDGFGAMKLALLRQLSDEESFVLQDADFPDLANASAAQVISRVSSLEREAIRKTERLLADVSWEPIIQAMGRCGSITIYAIGHSLDAVALFAHDMQRAGIRVTVVEEASRQREWASVCPRDELSVLVSYSGMSAGIVTAASILSHRGLLSLAVTANAKSDLAGHATWCIPIAHTQTHMAYDRVANIQANASQSFALNVLYSLYVSRNYNSVRQSISSGLERQGVRVVRSKDAPVPHFEPTGDALPAWVDVL